MFDPAQIGAPAPAAPPSFEDAVGQIKEILTGLATADGSDVDPQEEAEITKILAAVAKLAANRHKQEQAALGGGPATQFINRSLGGS